VRESKRVKVVCILGRGEEKERNVRRGNVLREKEETFFVDLDDYVGAASCNEPIYI
jgi:hypothetical protein